jgi:tetratricopeptide (TPR) repeat protein
VSVLMINWMRIWVQESKEPFQYTYSVGEFEREPAGKVAASPLDWLARDLTARLGERVSRLSLLDEAEVPRGDPESDPAAHVHISGWHGLRSAEDGGWMLEVVPEIRLGGKGAPAKLAQAIRFRLQLTGRRASHLAPALTDAQYVRLFERVYWSVASQIYAQIRRGVERKVGLLPPGRLRAAAYLHEADDYATSNTIDAYEAARTFYRKAQEIYDVGSRQPPATRWRRVLGGVRVDLSRDWRRARRLAAKVFRRVGRREILTSRAQLGFARMLVAEWHLKFLCGTVPIALYEAGPSIREVIARLRMTPADIDERDETLFRAYVTLATTAYCLQDPATARRSLALAEGLMPVGARDDPEFLFVAGMVEEVRVRALRLLGEAVELDPTMERAHFHRAQKHDELWRSREPLEPEVAELVDAEYAAVISINPGNLSAWANRGYIAWLLAEDPDAAGPLRGRGKPSWRERAFNALDAGRRYKEVRRDAMVGELDWSLSRLAAERGDFARAYEHYIQAVSAMLGEPRLAFVEYFYANATSTLVARFARYRATVLKKACEAEEAGLVEARLIASVKAFVLNDCGLVHLEHYRRFGGEEDLKEAHRLFEDAISANPGFVLPLFYIARLNFQQALATAPGPEQVARLESALEGLNLVVRREPDWVSAQLLMVEVQSRLSTVAAHQRREMRKSEVHTSSRLLPALAAPSAGGGLRRTDPRVRKAKLDDRQDRRNPELLDGLRRLLPHACFAAENGRPSALDTRGTQVDSLLRSQRDRWIRDYTETQVAALIQWAKVLAANACPSATSLCAELRSAYYPTHLDLLIAHQSAAYRLLERESDEKSRARLSGVVEECDELIQAFIVANVKIDPIDHDSLLDTVLLSPDERRATLNSARDASPSVATLTWIAGQQLALRDEDGAAKTCWEALLREAGSGTSANWLRLGELLIELKIPKGALAALRRGIHSADPEVTPIAAIKTARILDEEGKTEKAEREYQRAGSDPGVGLRVARLLDEEGLVTEAVKAYDSILARFDLEEGTRAEASFRLAELLQRDDEASPAAIDSLLDEAVATDNPNQHRAALLLARRRGADDPPAAEVLYRRTIADRVPETTAEATLLLGEQMEKEGRSEEAWTLYLRSARLHSWVAIVLGDRLRARERDDLAEPVYRLGANPRGRRPEFAADAMLRLGDLQWADGRKGDATDSYRAAIVSTDIHVAADAALTLGELEHGEGSSKESAAFYTALVRDVASATESKPSFVVTFCREFGERLAARGESEHASAVYSAAVQTSEDAALRLATALEEGGDPLGAAAVPSFG